jgi:hypothetical protein
MIIESNWIVPLVVVLASIGFGAVAIFGTKGSLGAGRARARGLAQALGLTYAEGREAMEAALVHADSTKAASWSALQRLPKPILDFFLSLAPWRIHGERSGVRVEIFIENRSSGKSSSTWTVARAWLPHPPEAEFRIAHEGFFTRLGKALFGLEDLELGDAEFDEALRVKAKDPLALRLRLDRVEARKALLALIGTHHGAFVTREYAQWERQGTRTDAAEIEAVLELLVPVALALGG